MEFPKHRILTTKQLIRHMKESNENNECFCFILGSGASVESGIANGSVLQMRWMDCLMGLADDLKTPARDLDSTRKLARELYEAKLMEHPFSEIEAAWRDAKEQKAPFSSEYYFDIYRLRFYPSRRNGFRYLEQIMDGREPSLGYHVLAKLLSSGVKNNLLITTNFDNLAEDALFLYTNKRPLVIGHEALAIHFEPHLQRPIIAKVHRSLMYAPFNTPETTSQLQPDWQDALSLAFNTYTPIVIGYAGGDKSLMTFMEADSTAMRNGVFWCYREESGLPEQRVLDFIMKKDGYLVPIVGFDTFMMEIGREMYQNEITPAGTDEYLKAQYRSRSDRYREQWDKLNQSNDSKNSAEQADHKKPGGKAGKKNVGELFQKAYQFVEEGRYSEGIEAYTEVIGLEPNNASAYHNRAIAYRGKGEPENAIRDYNKAIELDPNYDSAYNNCGIVYDDLGRYEDALACYAKAIELRPGHARHYYNRGITYQNMNCYQEAMADYSKAIEIKPDYADAYINRGIVYRICGQMEEAISDNNKAMELQPKDVLPYNNKGYIFEKLGKYEEAIECYSQAIQADPEYKRAYNNRARSYRAIGKIELAEADEEVASRL